MQPEQAQQLPHLNLSEEQVFERYRKMTDKEILAEMASKHVARMTQEQASRVISRTTGQIVSWSVPTANQVVGMATKRLFRYLAYCPFSAYYSWDFAELLQKFSSEYKLRQQVLIMSVKWLTFRALPDIQEKSFE